MADWEPTFADLRLLLRECSRVRFSPGELLCREGAPGDCVYLIRRGSVAVSKTTRGKLHALATRSRGDVVGEMALLVPARRSATMTAETEVLAYRLNRCQFEQVLEGSPRLALELLETLAGRFRRLQEALVEDLTRKMEELEQYNMQLEQRVEERTEELQEANERLADMAVRDYLTGCYNRRYFQESLDELHQRASLEGLGYCIFLFDVDHFKHYNDSNGHQLGDALLQGLARLAQSQIRSDDLVLARYGGEEFVILLPRAGREAAERVADRLRAAIAAQTFANSDSQPLGKISISGGVGVFPEDGEQAAQVLKKADERLYRAKASGRDRVLAD